MGLYSDTDSLAEKEPHQWRILAFDKVTGKVVWDTIGYQGLPRQGRHYKSSQCNSTPATNGKRIIAIFGSEGLFCFDMRGQLQWRRDLGLTDAGPYNLPKGQWGLGEIYVLRATNEFQLLATNSMGETCMATPAISEGRLFFRTREHLVTVGARE